MKKVFEKVSANGALALYDYPSLAELKATGTLRHQLYVTNTLLIVEAFGPVWDMPESIWCRFTYDEHNTIVRECFRLKIELYETILAKVSEVEKAHSQGQKVENYKVIQDRFTRIDEAYRMFPIISTFTEA